MGAGGSAPLYPTVDLSGKVIMVTGGNIGIGYATAKALSIMGAHTIITCRTMEKATAAIAQMKEEVAQQFPDKSINVEGMVLELGSFRSTKDLTVAFKEKNLPLHALVANAAVSMISERTLTEDGHETQFQVNHLSHFLLILELLPIMLDTASTTGDGRIVIVSSSAHENRVFDPENLEGDRSYADLEFYGRSKLYNVMTAYALQRRLKNVGITVSSLHPGFVQSNLLPKAIETFGTAKKIFYKGLLIVLSPMQKDTDRGAFSSLNCAINPELNSQQAFYYNSDCRPVASSAVSRDESKQEQLWEISINMIKEFLAPEVLERYGPSQPVQGTDTKTDKNTALETAECADKQNEEN